jgi:hypothetical protein
VVVAAEAGCVLGGVVRGAAGLDVLDDGCDCVIVVAEEGADEGWCGVVDGDDAKWIATKQATIGQMHRVQEFR